MSGWAHLGLLPSLSFYMECFSVAVQLFVFVAREPFILFCGYLDIGNRDYKGLYMWDDDFFPLCHCIDE